MCDSFITLNRKITRWEWYKNHKMVRFFIHCLLKANWEDRKHQGILIKRSTFMTSLANLSEETGLSVKEVRTCIKKLIDTGEIKTNDPKDKKKGKPYTIITICKYDDYQKKKNKGASDGQGEGTEGATTNKYNKEEQDYIIRDINENLKIALSSERYVKSITTNYGLSIERLRELYLEFNEHLEQIDKTVRTYTEYIAHFLNWYKNKYNIDPKTKRTRARHRTAL